MIYASLKPIREWHLPLVAPGYLVFGAFTGAALLALPAALAGAGGGVSLLAALLAAAALVLVVVPSHAFAETLHALAPHRPAQAGVAWATKGFEPGSGRFLHEVAGELLGPGVPLAVMDCSHLTGLRTAAVSAIAAPGGASCTVN